MSLVFDHVTLGQRVLFGAGKAAEHVAVEAERLGAHRVMVITSGSARHAGRGIVKGLNVVQWHEEVAMHVPLEVAQRARLAALETQADLIVAIGGGSTTGLAKAVALTTQLPIIAVPTTYSGSEATNVWGITQDGLKTTGVDDRVLPVAVVYDAELTVNLPVELSVASGLNGIAHCVDSLWAPRADPINTALALEGLRALAAGLPRIVADPTDGQGREEALYGAYLAAVAFASAGSGIHHKICHVLGGTFDLPHAQTHAVMLPQVLAFNAAQAPEACSRIAGVLGVNDAVSGLVELYESLNAPRALKDYGFTQESVALAVGIIGPLIPKSNPRAVTTENLTALLHSALTGVNPVVLT